MTSVLQGPASAADGHCEAVPQATNRHTRAGAASAVSGYSGVLFFFIQETFFLQK